MTQDSFAAFAAAKGWKCAGSNAYGVYRNYPFSVFLKTGRVSSLTVTFRLSAGLKGKAFRALSKSLPKTCSVMQPSVGALNLVCAGADDTLEEILQQGMEYTTQALREAGLMPPDTCPYCKKTGCDSLAALGGGTAGTVPTSRMVAAGVLGGAVGAAVAGQLSTTQALGYVPVHRACVEQRSGAAVAGAEKNMATGSYLRGFVGALLGGLVGAIPSILGVLLLESYIAILYFLIPLAAWYGYRLLGGKQSQGTFWLVALTSLFHAVFTTPQIFFYIQLVIYKDIWASPLESIPYFYHIFGMSDLILELIAPVAFTILGLVVTYGKISRTSSHDILDAGLAMETLSSYTPRSREL